MPEDIFHHMDLPEAWLVAKDLLCSSLYFSRLGFGSAGMFLRIKMYSEIK
jgi:hypothetical protein